MKKMAFLHPPIIQVTYDISQWQGCFIKYIYFKHKKCNKIENAVLRVLLAANLLRKYPSKH